MKRVVALGVLAALLSGCATVTERLFPNRGAETHSVAPPLDALAAPEETREPAPVLAPETAAPPPPPAARTAEALDTTTPEQRAAAVAAPEAPTRALGTTVVSLGSPTEPGLWLKTPLVSAEMQGRVVNPANGKSSLVTLLPLEGPETGGSRMSLAAMRLIDVPLTDLTEVEVTLEG